MAHVVDEINLGPVRFVSSKFVKNGSHGYYEIRLESSGNEIVLQVSFGGNSVRVFRNGIELLPPGASVSL